MDLREAPWEHRNLDVTCQELMIGIGDSLEDALVAVDTMTSQLQVVRVAPARQDVVHSLSARGFMFAEGMVTFEHSGSLPAIDPVAARLSERLYQVLASRQHREVVLRAVEGGLFTTDRISLHPAFTTHASARRYANWLVDEIDRGGELRIVMWGDRPVAFYSVRAVNRSPIVALSGVLDPISFPGLGIALQRCIVQYCLDHDLGPLRTKVSTNNLAALRAHVSSGFNLVDLEHVFMRLQASTTSNHV